MTPHQQATTSPHQGSTADSGTGQPVVCVITSEGDAERAEQLAHLLVERGLAGCVSLLPLTSIYLWDGQLEHSAEVQLLIKTTPGRLEALHQAVLERHSYDTPMWVQWQALADRGYGTWLAQVTAGPGAPPPAGAGSPGSGGPAG
ncbi:MAG: divalent-cation tolerance protein CutA [Synechococcaceae cyanobacterium]